jgi:hypothetical protein
MGESFLIFMASFSKRRAGATVLAVSMLTGATVAQAANIVPKNAVTAGSCIKSEYQPGLGCPDWADEFNGTEVNKDFWNVYNGYSEAKQDPYGKYSKDAVTVSDGQLHLTTKVGKDGQKGLSAEMTTNNRVAFEDGYWEYKLSYTGYGHVGGYLYGNGNVAGAQMGEIDGFEAFGKTDNSTRSEAGKREKFNQANKNQTIIHYSQAAVDAQTGKKSSHTKATWIPNKPAGEPVVVGILKNTDGVKIFRDGVLVQEMSSSDPNYAKTFPEGQPLNTTLTARVSNVYWGVQDNPTGGISVDYVRHYPLVSVAEEPTASPSAEPTATTKPTTEAPAPVVTPSAEPTVTASPSASAKPTVTASPSAEPTTEAPTPIITPSTEPSTPAPPTASAEPTATTKPTTEAPAPVVTPSVEPTTTVAAPDATPSSASESPTGQVGAVQNDGSIVDSANGKKVLVKTGHEDGDSIPIWAIAGLGACVALLGGVLGWLLWWKPRRDAAEDEE